MEPKFSRKINDWSGSNRNRESQDHRSGSQSSHPLQGCASRTRFNQFQPYKYYRTGRQPEAYGTKVLVDNQKRCSVSTIFLAHFPHSVLKLLSARFVSSAAACSVEIARRLDQSHLLGVTASCIMMTMLKKCLLLQYVPATVQPSLCAISIFNPNPDVPHTSGYLNQQTLDRPQRQRNITMIHLNITVAPQSRGRTY